MTTVNERFGELMSGADRPIRPTGTTLILTARITDPNWNPAGPFSPLPGTSDAMPFKVAAEIARTQNEWLIERAKKTKASCGKGLWRWAVVVRRKKGHSVYLHSCRYYFKPTGPDDLPLKEIQEVRLSSKSDLTENMVIWNARAFPLGMWKMVICPLADRESTDDVEALANDIDTTLATTAAVDDAVRRIDAVGPVAVSSAPMACPSSIDRPKRFRLAVNGPRGTFAVGESLPHHAAMELFEACDGGDVCLVSDR